MTEAVLRQMIADLDGYIERRAAELAAPLIAAAQAEVEAAAGRAKAADDRRRDVCAEMGRQMVAQERQLAKAILAGPETGTGFNRNSRIWARGVLAESPTGVGHGPL